MPIKRERKNTMNVQIKPAPPKPMIEEEITVNGIRIGRIKKSDNTYFIYHAIIDSEVDRGIAYQGFGDTYDEAMRNAIDKSKIKHAEHLKELDKLENVIWGDHELN